MQIYFPSHNTHPFSAFLPLLYLFFPFNLNFYQIFPCSNLFYQLFRRFRVPFSYFSQSDVGEYFSLPLPPTGAGEGLAYFPLYTRTSCIEI